MRRLMILLFSFTLALAPVSAALHMVGLDKSYYTSDVMIGKVIVSVIFIESNGTYDTSTENWDDGRKGQVLGEIMQGLNWWTQQNTRSPLSFSYVSQTLYTKYEPITRPYYHESLWIPDALGNLGYSGNRFTATRNYVNDLRNTHDADWGFVIYVLDSLHDSNGKLSDGLFAYAYLGGPFMVMTYDNGGYGIGNMDVVAAHEAGHIFNALDEYAGASSPYDYSTGYFRTINGNHAWSPIANEPNSIMRGGIRWGLSEWTEDAIGWKDANNNNRDDIVDNNATVGVVTESLSSPSKKEFSGSVSIPVVARQGNSQGNGFTLDTIAEVKYRLTGGNWNDASSSDGQFDSATENFLIEIVAPEASSAEIGVTATDVEVQAMTSYELGIQSTGGGGGGNSGPASTLDQAHAFPNPFKPNSNVGHTSGVGFSNLTANAKIQILTTAGEPVFEVVADGNGTCPNWNASNEDGTSLATGIYFYLITDPAGGEKTGKLAIIR